MSSPNSYTLSFTELALKDLEDILLYTLTNWGVEQQEKYALLLEKALQLIQTAPRFGKNRPQLPADYLVYHVGRHFVIYRLEKLNIIVLRVLHDQMDLPQHFM